MVKAVFDSNILIDFLQGRLEAKGELERYDDGPSASSPGSK